MSVPDFDMSGKTVIITGANSGIGYETAKKLALTGAKVIMACRSHDKSKAAILRLQADLLVMKAEGKLRAISQFDTSSIDSDLTNTNNNYLTTLPVIQENEVYKTMECQDTLSSSETLPGILKSSSCNSLNTNNDNISQNGSCRKSKIDSPPLDITTDILSAFEVQVDTIHLDLTSLSSVKSFVQEFTAKHGSLDVIICNAGTGFIQRAYTEDGFELNFQVNYLAHLLLITQLVPLMKENENGCLIVNVACSCYCNGSLNLANINGYQSYSKSKMLANAKLFQVMMMGSLERRLKSTNVFTVTVDPGLTNTSIFNSMKESTIFRYKQKFKKWFGGASDVNDIQVGAENVIYPIAIAPCAIELRGFFFDQRTPKSILPHARRGKDQEVLWNYSMECLSEFLSGESLSALKLKTISKNLKKKKIESNGQ